MQHWTTTPSTFREGCIGFGREVGSGWDGKWAEQGGNGDEEVSRVHLQKGQVQQQWCPLNHYPLICLHRSTGICASNIKSTYFAEVLTLGEWNQCSFTPRRSSEAKTSLQDSVDATLVPLHG